MANASIESARKIAEFAAQNIGFKDAVKLCKALDKSYMNEFQRSIQADMVCRFAQSPKEDLK